MINLTELEKIVLEDITRDDFYEEELDSVIWADVFVDMTCSLDPTIARGVLSSLVKKEIIHPIKKGRDGTISFTEFGKQIMEELGNKHYTETEIREMVDTADTHDRIAEVEKIVRANADGNLLTEMLLILAYKSSQIDDDGSGNVRMPE